MTPIEAIKRRKYAIPTGSGTRKAPETDDESGTNPVSATLPPGTPATTLPATKLPTTGSPGYGAALPPEKDTGVFAGAETLEDMTARYRAALAAHSKKGAAITAARAAKDAENPNFRGNTPRPLSEFRDELDTERAADKQARADMNLEKQAQTVARANLRALRDQIRTRRAVSPDMLESANRYLAERSYGLGSTDNVDDRLGYFKSRVLKRWGGTPSTLPL